MILCKEIITVYLKLSQQIYQNSLTDGQKNISKNVNCIKINWKSNERILLGIYLNSLQGSRKYTSHLISIIKFHIGSRIFKGNFVFVMYAKQELLFVLKQPVQKTWCHSINSKF